MAPLREHTFGSYGEELDWNLARFVLLNWATFTAAQSLMKYSEGGSILISGTVSLLFLILLGTVQFFPKTVYWAMLGMFIVAHLGWVFLYFAESGMQGISPFILIAGLVIFISLFKSWTRITVIGIMLSTAILVIYFTELLPLEFVNEPQENIEYNYLVFTLFICFMLIYLKSNLHSSTEMVLSANDEMLKRNKQLEEQGIELHSSREKIELINGGLVQMVDERVSDIQKNNEELSEYAFVNAHLLRAPLTRVLGLVNLLELSQGLDKEELKVIRHNATGTDEIVRKINKKLS